MTEDFALIHFSLSAVNARLNAIARMQEQLQIDQKKTEEMLRDLILAMRKRQESRDLIASRRAQRESEGQRRHTGSHPITEVQCDDSGCWCHQDGELNV